MCVCVCVCVCVCACVHCGVCALWMGKCILWWLISELCHCSGNAPQSYRFFLQINLHIMRRILSTTFIPCSHGEIRFLRSKKKQESKTTVRNPFLESNPIYSRTRNLNRTRFQKLRNQTALSSMRSATKRKSCSSQCPSHDP